MDKSPPNETFKQLVSAWIRYRKEGGEYETLSDNIGAYWRDQLGNLYEMFYTDVKLGVSVGLGWIELYVKACKGMQEILTANPTFRIKVIQVKQKFGDLRIYARMWSEGMPGDEHGDHLLDPSHELLRDQVDAIITAAAIEATRTCEICGKPGALVTTNGYYHIACTNHSKP